jgi:hypothetical protein
MQTAEAPANKVAILIEFLPLMMQFDLVELLLDSDPPVG